MPSPEPDVIIASIALVEISATTIITDSCKQRQRVNRPAVFVLRRFLILVQVNELLPVVIEQKFSVELEVIFGSVAFAKSDEEGKLVGLSREEVYLLWDFAIVQFDKLLNFLKNRR